MLSHASQQILLYVFFFLRLFGSVLAKWHLAVSELVTA